MADGDDAVASNARALRPLRQEYARAAAPMLRTLAATAAALSALKAEHHAKAGRDAQRFAFGLEAEDSLDLDALAAQAEALLARVEALAAAAEPPPLPREAEDLRAVRRGMRRGGRGGARARPY